MISIEQLDELFYRFLNGEVSIEAMETTRDRIDAGDVDSLISFVASLNDPGEYCTDDLDQHTPARYSLFIDFVSALIINLGAPGRAGMAKHADTQYPFVKWIVKFVSDERFHEEIFAKFAQVFD